jgi:hypothetical protein
MEPETISDFHIRKCGDNWEFVRDGKLYVIETNYAGLLGLYHKANSMWSVCAGTLREPITVSVLEEAVRVCIKMTAELDDEELGSPNYYTLQDELNHLGLGRE